MIIKPAKWMQLIVHIEDANLSRLSFKLDCTYSHLTKLVKEFEDNKWITREKKGRTIVNTLTPKGKEMQQNIVSVLSEIGGVAYVR